MPAPVELAPRIPTGSRPVWRGRGSAAAMLAFLYLLPLMCFGIALADDRVGFRLLMASLGAALLAIAIGLHVRSSSLRTGHVRIDARGPLRFVPSRAVRAIGVIVPLVFALPVIAMALIGVYELPTQPSGLRLGRAMPWVLGGVVLVSLARTLWSLRVPVGLRVDAEGLRGVRGGPDTTIAWEQLVSATTPGDRGPTLALLTHPRGLYTLDANHLGSDPAIVAAVIEYYRARPGERDLLAGDGDDGGVEALRRVERFYEDTRAH